MKIILSSKNKSGDLTSFNTKTLKYISPVISPILCQLINNSLTSGLFPDCLKMAKVISIYKKGDR